MKKEFNWFDVSSMFAVFFCVGILAAMIFTAIPPKSESEPVEQMFDTSIIEGNWCRGDDEGTIRMVGAWMVEDNNGLYTLEDETGHLWQVADVLIQEDDFLLLWIADCGTPEVEDDLILKCWAEVH